jgi:ElaB/YqjD/DUF883 family membrane-anchored ribosome-binding protein
MAADINETRSGEVEKIKDDLRSLRDDLGKLLGHIGSVGKGRLGGTREKMGAAVEDFQERAYDRLQETGRHVSDHGRHAMGVSRDAVQQKPLTYIAVAFVAGMVLASLIEWKRS